MSCIDYLKSYKIYDNDPEITRKKFRDWALKNHPDKGGNAELFKFISNCHDLFQEGKLKRTRRPSPPRTQLHPSTPTDEEQIFADLFDSMDLESNKRTSQRDIYNMYKAFALPKKAWEAIDFCDKPSDRVEFTLYQQFLREFVKTKRHGILLYHMMGAGKSLSSVNMADALYKSGKYNKINVLLPGSLRANFVTEKNKMFPKLPIDLYTTNANTIITGLPLLDNSIVIIDEIHNVVSMVANNSKIGNHLYNSIVRAKNCFVIGLTGTPLINDPYEVAIMINLIKPNSFKLNRSTFIEEYYDRVHLRIKNKSKFYNKIHNLISYYEGPSADSDIFPIVTIKNVELKMKPAQAEFYEEQRIMEGKGKTFGKEPKKVTEADIITGTASEKQTGMYQIFTRQACNMAYYDNADEIPTRDLVNNLGKFSVKFEKLIKYIHESPPGPVVVFSNFVKSTLKVIGRILTHYGIRYRSYTGDDDATCRRQTLTSFNSPSNQIKVLLVSMCGAEGISLKNVRQVHVMESYWNEAKISQVIARAVRLCSHNSLPPHERTVTVYRYTALMDNLKTADQILSSIAERKSKLNNDFDELMKISALDCLLNIHQNKSVKPGSCYEQGTSSGGRGYTEDPQPSSSRGPATYKRSTLRK